MVLTCGRCNNQAGTVLDSQWDQASRVELFVKGELSVPTRGRLAIGDDSVPITITAVNNQISMMGAPRASEPGALQRIMDTYERASRGLSQPEFRIEFGQHHHRKAQIAHLRAAYLVAFCKLGYRYAARLAALREQISVPDVELIAHFHARTEAPESGRRGIYLGVAAGIGECVVVTFGHETVILPPPSNSPDAAFWEALAGDAESGQAFHFEGKGMGWPAAPEYRLDE